MLLGYVASRGVIYGLLYDAISDVPVYFDYAVAGVDRGRMPYRDIAKLEYPPTAYWAVCLPRYLSSWRLPEVDEPRLRIDPQYAAEYDALRRRHLNHYDWGFRGLMLACDVVAFAALASILARRRPRLVAAGAATYVIVTSLLAVLLLDRFDIGLTALLLVWAYAWLRAAEPNDRGFWSALSYAALGAGISFKLIPVLAVPFVLLGEARQWYRDRKARRLVIGPAVLLAFGAGPFVYYYAQAGDDLGRLFAYHSRRGVQIESTFASAMMLVDAHGKLNAYYDYGAWNLAGPGERTLAQLSPWLTVGLLGLLGLRCLAARRFGADFDAASAYRAVCVAIPLAAATSKVLSPQYFLWILPLSILAAAEFAERREFLAVCAAMIVIAALTTFVFPLHYMETLTITPPYDRNLPPPFALMRNITAGPPGGPVLVAGLSTSLVPIAALCLRNLLFVALATSAAYQFLRPSDGGTRIHR